MPVRKKEKEMKIHLKKVLVSLLVIISFVSYALYQRFLGPQQTTVADGSPDTVADLGTSETVSTTTVSQADNQSASQPETVPATSQSEKVSGNIGEDEKFKLLDDLDKMVKDYNEKIREMGDQKEEEIQTI